MFTRLTVDQVRLKLNSITHKADTIEKGKLFQGVIKGYNFELYPLYNLGVRGSFSHVIQVNIEDIQEYSKVHLLCVVPKYVKSILSLAFILNVIVLLVLCLLVVCYSNLINHKIWESGLIILIYFFGLIFGLFSFLLGFKYKVGNSIRLIKERLEATQL